MGGQLVSKAHVNFRQFTAVLSVCGIPCCQSKLSMDFTNCDDNDCEGVSITVAIWE